MTPNEVDILVASSPLAWIDLYKFVNENQQLLEFKDHRFLIDFYADEADDIVARKSAQVGFSVAAILKSFHAAKFGGYNIIYALPTNNVVQDFVKPKVNPLISYNAPLQAVVTDDSVSYKRVGDRNIFFKGGFSDRDAISITGDILVIDEYDRMPDMGVVNTFDSRLQASRHPKRWRFSNPSQVGFGTDALYQNSDQRHWFIRHACGYEWFIDWESDGVCHYVDRERKVYACGKCNGEITDGERRMGRWVRKYKEVERHGYWFSQLIAPWVSANRIIEQYEESSIDFFHNFVLGKAYTPSDLIVNRETILRACAPSTIPKVSVAIGVDQKAAEMEWVAGTSQGIFAHGKVKSWEEIEHLKLMYNAIVVSDPAPYPTMPKLMAQRYTDWYLCYFKESKQLDILEWKNQIVYADRTRVLDLIAKEITEARLLFREAPHALEDIISDFNNIYRTTVEQPDGRSKSTWLKKENKESDYPFAIAYMRIGLTKTMGGQSNFLEPQSGQPDNLTDVIAPGGQLMTTLSNIVDETFAELD